MRFASVTALMIMLLLGGTAVLHAEDDKIRTENNAKAQAEISIDDFVWLVGHWRGEAGGSTMEEFWCPPTAGAMQCVFRMFSPEGEGFYQFIVLGKQDGVFMLRLKHFTKEVKGVEEKDQTLDYVFLDRDQSMFYFNNLTFERNSADEFTVHVKTGEGENSSVISLKYERVNEDKTP
jgi:hypothetical protein